MLGLIPPFLGLEIETLRPPEKTISYEEMLQLGKGGMDDPLGGLPPPRPLPLAKVFVRFLT